MVAAKVKMNANGAHTFLEVSTLSFAFLLMSYLSSFRL